MSDVEILPTSEAPKTEIKPVEKQSNQRFILFIGNLPFTATAEQIRDHFLVVPVP